MRSSLSGVEICYLIWVVCLCLVFRWLSLVFCVELQLDIMCGFGSLVWDREKSPWGCCVELVLGVVPNFRICVKWVFGCIEILDFVRVSLHYFCIILNMVQWIHLSNSWMLSTAESCNFLEFSWLGLLLFQVLYALIIYLEI